MTYHVNCEKSIIAQLTCLQCIVKQKQPDMSEVGERKALDRRVWFWRFWSENCMLSVGYLLLQQDPLQQQTWNQSQHKSPDIIQKLGYKGFNILCFQRIKHKKYCKLTKVVLIRKLHVVRSATTSNKTHMQHFAFKQAFVGGGVWEEGGGKTWTAFHQYKISKMFHIFKQKRLGGGDVFEEGGGKTNRGRRAVERNNRVNRWLPA